MRNYQKGVTGVKLGAYDMGVGGNPTWQRQCLASDS